MITGKGTDSWLSSLLRRSFKAPEADNGMIGILAFEVASLMSKLVKLWRSLSDPGILKLKEEILNSTGIRKLVSEDVSYLMSLVFDEVISDVACVARSVVRLGKRCTDPSYHRLESFFLDLTGSRFEWSGWEYRWKKMDRKVKKMERFVGLMLQLIQEEEALLEVKQTLRRMKANHGNRNLQEFQHKANWHRHQIRDIRVMSPWSRTFDYNVRLLTRSIFTILERLSYAFGMDDPDTCMSPSNSFSARMQSSVHPSGSCHSISDLDRTTRAFVPLRGMGCIDGGIHSPVLERSNSMIDEPVGRFSDMNRTYSRLSFFYSKRAGSLLVPAPRHILGEAALAIHYARVIVFIEKLASSKPHLIGPDARDDLYNMLPFSIRAAVRARLKSSPKARKLSIYNAAIAAMESNKLISHTLGWLAPLAHNTIKWQNEQNIEEQHMVPGSTVLLVQTLFFADRAKTESTITELLVRLSYLCKIHRAIHQKD